MWLYGSQLRRISSGRVGDAARTPSTLLTRLPCVSITPLGGPVVPEVYMIVASDSGPRCASRRASSPARAARRLRPRCRNDRHEQTSASPLPSPPLRGRGVGGEGVRL